MDKRVAQYFCLGFWLIWPTVYLEMPWFNEASSVLSQHGHEEIEGRSGEGNPSLPPAFGESPETRFGSGIAIPTSRSSRRLQEAPFWHPTRSCSYVPQGFSMAGVGEFRWWYNHMVARCGLFVKRCFCFPRLQVKMSIQIRNSVKVNIPVATILRNLIASGFQVDFISWLLNATTHL